MLQFHLQHCSLCLVVSPSSGSKWFIFSFQWVQVVQVVQVMASPKDLKVPSGQEETINTAFRDVNKLKHKITFAIADIALIATGAYTQIAAKDYLNFVESNCVTHTWDPGHWAGHP